ncbi:hypothetical protein KKG71_00980 [Patescibacteria group bacterium]|nr:hypothetical protein [Patescibacteria group bacterium]
MKLSDGPSNDALENMDPGVQRMQKLAMLMERMSDASMRDDLRVNGLKPTYGPNGEDFTSVSEDLVQLLEKALTGEESAEISMLIAELNSDIDRERREGIYNSLNSMFAKEIEPATEEEAADLEQEYQNVTGGSLDKEKAIAADNQYGNVWGLAQVSLGMMIYNMSEQINLTEDGQSELEMVLENSGLNPTTIKDVIFLLTNKSV